MKTSLQDARSALSFIQHVACLAIRISGRGLAVCISFFTVVLIVRCKAPKEIQGASQITAFNLTGIKALQTNIDDASGQIEVIVPFGSLLQALTADISISPDASIVPSGQTVQDYTRPVYYTVTSAVGTKKVYTVLVKSQPQNSPVIEKLSTDTLRAGQKFTITGTDFGKFNAAVKVALEDRSGKTISVPSVLLDSAHVQVTVPLRTEPGIFKVAVIRNDIASATRPLITIKIPAPEISAVKRVNLLQGDTIVIAGSFILPEKYRYSLSLISSQSKQTLQPLVAETGKVYFKTTTSLPPGSYQLQLINQSESIGGALADQSVRIYDAQLPFATGVKNLQPSYQASSALTLSTTNFEKLPARFYQIKLESEKAAYNINGIYSSNQSLAFELPANIATGPYAVSVLLLSDTGELLYDIRLDDTITIKQ